MSETGEDRMTYPYQDNADIVVLGPEVFASSDGSVVCWRGENYYPTRRPWWERVWLRVTGGGYDRRSD